MNSYSTLRHNQEILIIKTPEASTPFVIATCYHPDMAQTICDLLTKSETEQGAEQHES